MAAAAFEQRSIERADSVARFQRFAATGLLLAAWPEATVPDLTGSWTIDPALTLARRTEQALTDVRHDDAAWERVQKEVAGDATDLQRALNARSHQAHGRVERLLGWSSTFFTRGGGSVPTGLRSTSARRSPSATSC